MNDFLKTSLDKALIYTTPEKLLVWIKLKSLIWNPEFKSKVDLHEKIMFITKQIYGKRNDHTAKFNPNDFTYDIKDDYINVLENDFCKRIYFKIPIENLALNNEDIIWRIIYPKLEPIIK
jgi:hypothetical protein